MRSNSATKRILKEIKALSRDDSTDVILLREDDNDLLRWKAWILGPPDSPYEGAYFQLSIDVPVTYPLNPPTVKFLTPVFHPNILYKVCFVPIGAHTKQEGEICLDLLKSSEAWTAVYVVP